MKLGWFCLPETWFPLSTTGDCHERRNHPDSCVYVCSCPALGRKCARQTLGPAIQLHGPGAAKQKSKSANHSCHSLVFFSTWLLICCRQSPATHANYPGCGSNSMDWCDSWQRCPLNATIQVRWLTQSSNNQIFISWKDLASEDPVVASCNSGFNEPHQGECGHRGGKLPPGAQWGCHTLQLGHQAQQWRGLDAPGMEVKGNGWSNRRVILVGLQWPGDSSWAESCI